MLLHRPLGTEDEQWYRNIKDLWTVRTSGAVATREAVTTSVNVGDPMRGDKQQIKENISKQTNSSLREYIYHEIWMVYDGLRNSL